MSQLILGLGNKARHGKDSFAKAIETYFANINHAALKHRIDIKPVVVQQIAFADALYREVNEWLGDHIGWAENYNRLQWTVDGTRDGIQIPSWVIPTESPELSARSPLGKHAKLLQWWGTEYRRNQNPNYWTDQWKKAINPYADIVLTTDMRFINEAEVVKAAGGFTVRVSRLNTDGTPFVDPSRDAAHVSETQLDGYDFDYQITVKTGDLVLLEEWAITLVHYLRALKGK
jgi:hypothetical protein